MSRVSSSRPRGRGQCGTRAANLQPTRAHARAQASEFDLLPRSGTVVVLVSGAACWLLGRPGNTPGPSHSAAPALTEGCDHPEPTRGDSEQHRTGCALHGPDHDRKRSALPVGVPASLDPARGGGRLNLGVSPFSRTGLAQGLSILHTASPRAPSESSIDSSGRLLRTTTSSTVRPNPPITLLALRRSWL